jgi:hypothetical protein
MKRWIISSQRDVRTWLFNERPDVDTVGLLDAVIDEIACDPEAPGWGEDWTAYLTGVDPETYEELTRPENSGASLAIERAALRAHLTSPAMYAKGWR